MIKILSLKQPWAWLMTHGIQDVPMKDVENRKWATSYRGPVLVHASLNWDKDAFPKSSLMVGRYYRPEVVPEEIVAVMPGDWSEFPMGGVVGVFTITDCLKASNSPWFFGPYGFLVEDQKPLPFAPWKGQLGLRDAPAELLALLGLDENGRGVKP